MLKNYADHALTIYEGIFLDAATRWPSLHASLEWDLSYLRGAFEHRGFQFYGELLPAMCKVTDRWLDNGCLEHLDIPKGYPKHSCRPNLLGGLYDLVFDECNMLRPDADIDAVAFIRQILLVCKKVRIPHTSLTLERTLNEYFEIERQLPPSHPGTWDSDVPSWQFRYGHPLWGVRSESSPELFALDDRDNDNLPWDSLRNLCRRVISGIGVPNWWDLRPKHGPGVVSDSKQGLKYEFPFWPRKLGLWFPYDWFGAGILDTDHVPSDREPSSRLIAVPKTLKGPRLICAEPTAHQWMQQSIWRWLEEACYRSPLLRESITFRSQENSRRRALDASLNPTHATVDLSSASDRVSTRLVEYVFQGSEILDGLHACRTRVLGQELVNWGGLEKFHLLRKFSTQGSAATFPVQTIIFTILSVWALRLSDGEEWDISLDSLKKSFSEVTVFGDDIIIPVRALESLKLVLHQCGLKVNESKTFGGLHFRESCGVDAFKGYDVTPAYILEPYDGSASSMATTVETANNLFIKGFWHASDAVVSTIPVKERKLLRICGSDDGNFGLRSFVGTDISHLRTGWDSDLQRSYSISLRVDSKVTRQRGQGTADLSQYFFERPDPLTEWSAGQVSSVRVRKARARVHD